MRISPKVTVFSSLILPLPISGWSWSGKAPGIPDSATPTVLHNKTLQKIPYLCPLLQTPYLPEMERHGGQSYDQGSRAVVTSASNSPVGVQEIEEAIGWDALVDSTNADGKR